LISEKFYDLFKHLPVNDSIEKKINVNFLQEICDVFEKESGKTLFGLDFLYNEKNNIYSVIDCNYFPGYKETNNEEFCKLLKNHIITYYEDFKNKK